MNLKYHADVSHVWRMVYVRPLNIEHDDILLDGFYWNDCSVCMNPLEYKVKLKGIDLHLEMAQLHGFYGCSFSIWTGYSGRSSGISYEDCYFETEEEALNKAKEGILQFLGDCKDDESSCKPKSLNDHVKLAIKAVKVLRPVWQKSNYEPSSLKRKTPIEPVKPKNPEVIQLSLF